jgi:CPA2 family monovalent cation:H+ antiporter-2
MDHISPIRQVLIFLTVVVILLPLCRKLRISPVLGYLSAGLIVGPYGVGLLANDEAVDMLGELGIVFLLFTIGLELSLERLKTMSRYVFGLGSLQMAITAVLIGGVAWVAGLNLAGAVIIGPALAFSSTAFVLQVLQDRGLIMSRIGRRSIAILILQDLAVAPLLVVIPIITNPNGEMWSALGLASIKAGLAIGLIVGLGRFAMRPLFRAAAASKSPEAFIGTILLVTMGTSLGTDLAGLSSGLGAFLAGIMLAGTEYRHQIESDMEPFRGLLLGLFFLAVGMMIDISGVIRQFDVILLVLLGLLTAKALIIGLLAYRFGLSRPSSIQLGLLLSQGGEFAFVVLDKAVLHEMIPPDHYYVLAPVVALSMAVTPLLAIMGEKIAHRFRSQQAEDESKSDTAPTNHIIIAGLGRVGRIVAMALREKNIPYIAIEHDPMRVIEARTQGYSVMFGDSGRINVMRKVGVAQARAVVLTMESPRLTARTLAILRRECPSLHILVRAREENEMIALEKYGANVVVLETLEGSLLLAAASLKISGIPADEVGAMVENIRQRKSTYKEPTVPVSPAIPS